MKTADASEKVTFSGTRLLSFARTPKKGGTARFRAVINDHVCEKMDWPHPDERITSADPEGDLAAPFCELIPVDKELRKYTIELTSQRVNGFVFIRRELENKKGKGFRHELQFDVHFGDTLGCAKLEDFMLNAGSAKCGLIVKYNPEPKQVELPGTRVAMDTGEQNPDQPSLLTTAEQRASVAEIPDGDPNVEYVDRARARMEEKKKRGRPSKADIAAREAAAQDAADPLAVQEDVDEDDGNGE